MPELTFDRVAARYAKIAQHRSGTEGDLATAD